MRFQVTTLGKLFIYTCASVAKQLVDLAYKLTGLPVKGR